MGFGPSTRLRRGGGVAATSRAPLCRAAQFLQAALVTSALACSSDGASLEVALVFDPAALAGDVTGIELNHIAACDEVGAGDEPARLRDRWSFSRGEPIPALGRIGERRGAIYARGFDGECGVIAAGCTDFATRGGRSTRVVVTLVPVTDGPGCPAGQTCQDKVCRPVDADTEGGAPDDPCDGAPDGMECTLETGVGRCYREACCTGCVDEAATRCVTEVGVAACGAAGSACETCCAGDTCDTGLCAPASAVTAVAPGYDHTCAIDSAGALWCWGANPKRQVGVGTAGEVDCFVEGGDADLCIPAPANVGTPPGHAERTWAAVTTGHRFTCAIDSAGQLHCWGANGSGQVGKGTIVSTGEAVATLTPVGTLDGNPWTRVSAAYDHACGLRADGSLWCWGEGLNYRLGIGATTTDAAAPTRVEAAWPGKWTDVATGNIHSCALYDADGDGAGAPVVHCVGNAVGGKTGTCDTTGCGNTTAYSPIATPGVVAPERLMLGEEHGCVEGAATEPAGATWYCWGVNLTGVMGDATIDRDKDPLPMDWNDYDPVATGIGAHSCGIDAAGALWCWGRSSSNQTGEPAYLDTALAMNAVARRVGTRSDWREIALGRRHSCAINAAGALYCWGANPSFQLGAMTPGAGTHTATQGVPTRVCLE